MNNKVKFYTSFDSKNVNRLDFFEIVKDSYIQKMSNLIEKHMEVNGGKLPDAGYWVTMNGKLLSMGTEKLDKYNLNFAHEGIHLFYSQIEQRELPIHVNLYRLDSFIESLKVQLTTSIARNLQSKKDISITNEELEILSNAVWDFLNISRVMVSYNLTNKFDITYASSGDDLEGAAADEKFLVEPFETYLINKPNEQFMDGTGIYAGYNTKSSSIDPLDEAYNNYISRLYMSDERVKAGAIDSSLYNWVHQLVIEADYLNLTDDEKKDLKAKDLLKIYDELHIDYANFIYLDLYDEKNVLFVERSTDFNTDDILSAGSPELNEETTTNKEDTFDMDL